MLFYFVIENVTPIRPNGLACNRDWARHHKYAETQNIFANCGEASTKQPLEGTRGHGDADMKTHSCSGCGCMLKTESDVLAHMCTDVHENQARKDSPGVQDKHGGIHAPYLCGDCGKTFGSSPALIRHQRLHTSDGAYKCPYCDKTFHQSWNLNAHKRTHTGEKPFTCLACGKTFTTSSNLVVHNRTHTGERPHVCGVCGAAFSRIMHLTRHKRTHTGQRPYLCEVCGKSFRQKWTLNQHERTHSTQQPYVCSKCGQGFKQRSGYKQHNKRHHATIVLNEPCLLDTVII